MEFKVGDPDRGRTMFEGIVTNYPKRVDLWSVYLDMEIRAGQTDITRYWFCLMLDCVVVLRALRESCCSSVCTVC